MNFGFGRVATKLGLDVARSINAGRVEIAEVMMNAGLPLLLIAIAAL